MTSFGLMTVPRFDPDTIVSHYALAEENGMDIGWIADYANSKDIYSILALVGLSTRTMKIGPGVTNPYTRHPTVTASAIATVNEISKGRAILGIAPGDQTFLWRTGVKREDPLRAMEEAVLAIRRILAEGETEFNGKTLKIPGFQLFYKTASKIPIYVGARGPKMLEMAGRIGDGVIMNYSHPDEVAYATKCVKRGVDAGAVRNDPDITTVVIFSSDKDVKKARAPIAWMVALITASALPDLLGRHHIPEEKAAKVREVAKKKGVDQASLLLTDDMFDAFSCSGKSSDCIERAQEILKLGIDGISFSCVHRQPEEVTEQISILGKSIIPYLR